MPATGLLLHHAVVLQLLFVVITCALHPVPRTTLNAIMTATSSTWHTAGGR